MDFDPNKALAYARALSCPRLVGSGEDERVAQEVVAQLKSFGYQVEREPFQFTRAFDLALAYEIGLALFLILLAIFVPFSRPAVGLGLFLLLLGAPLLASAAQRRAFRPTDNVSTARPENGVYQTANIVARPVSHISLSPVKPPLYLMAHFDSKSQHMPIVLRVGLIGGFILGVLVFCISLLIPLPGILPFSYFVGGLTCLLGIPLLFLDVGNDSPGAIDNAAGMGLVLHLAEILQTRPDLLNNVRLTILITSAEEMATMGSLHHVNQHYDELQAERRKHSLYFFNFDGIGTDGRLFITPELSPLQELVTQACEELKIPLGRFLLPGLLFDHVPFSVAGFDAVSLMSIGRASWAVHTSKDTVDKLTTAGFERAGKVALKVIEWIVTGKDDWAT